MTFKIVLVLLLAAVSLIAAKATREVRVEEVDYVVQYEYDENGMYSLPAIEGARPHYEGVMTTVYKKEGKDLKYIFSGRGVYVKGGPCFEDDPEKIVRSILKSKKEGLNNGSNQTKEGR